MWRVIGCLLGGTCLVLAASWRLFSEEQVQPGLGDLLLSGFQYTLGTGMLLVGVGRMRRPASSGAWRRAAVAAFGAGQSAHMEERGGLMLPSPTPRLRRRWFGAFMLAVAVLQWISTALHAPSGLEPGQVAVRCGIGAMTFLYGLENLVIPGKKADVYWKLAQAALGVSVWILLDKYGF